MLEEARKALPGTRFELARLDEWQPDRAYDLIYGNAVLQWLPDHRTLVPKLAGHLAPGGTVAFQMPDNLGEPSHVSMADTVAAGPWASRLEAARIRDDLLSPAGYYALLSPICSQIDIWRTVYHHVMDSPGSDRRMVQGLGAASPARQARRGRARGVPRGLYAAHHRALSAPAGRQGAAGLPAPVHRRDAVSVRVE